MEIGENQVIKIQSEDGSIRLELTNWHKAYTQEGSDGRAVARTGEYSQDNPMGDRHIQNRNQQGQRVVNVYRAIDRIPGHGETYYVRVLDASDCQDGASYEYQQHLLRNEFEALKTAQKFDLGAPRPVVLWKDEEDRFFLVMSEVKKLKDLNNDPKPPRKPRECSQVVEKCLEYLDAMHRCCLYHRDIKPEHILVAREKGKLVIRMVDFGLAGFDGAAVSIHPYLHCTPQYAPPEQNTEAVKAKTLDKLGNKADVFAMCSSLYYWITGLNFTNLMTNPTPAQYHDMDRGMQKANAYEAFVRNARAALEHSGAPFYICETIMRGMDLNEYSRLTSQELLETFRKYKPPAPPNLLELARTAAGGLLAFATHTALPALTKAEKTISRGMERFFTDPRRMESARMVKQFLMQGNVTSCFLSALWVFVLLKALLPDIRWVPETLGGIWFFIVFGMKYNDWGLKTQSVLLGLYSFVLPLLIHFAQGTVDARLLLATAAGALAGFGVGLIAERSDFSTPSFYGNTLPVEQAGAVLLIAFFLPAQAISLLPVLLILLVYLFKNEAYSWWFSVLARLAALLGALLLTAPIHPWIAGADQFAGIPGLAAAIQESPSLLPALLFYLALDLVLWGVASFWASLITRASQFKGDLLAALTAIVVLAAPSLVISSAFTSWVSIDLGAVVQSLVFFLLITVFGLALPRALWRKISTEDSQTGEWSARF